MALDYHLLHDPSQGPMHVVAFASGTGMNFRDAVLESQSEGSSFSINLLITDKQFEKRKTREDKERKEIGTIKSHNYHVAVILC